MRPFKPACTPRQEHASGRDSSYTARRTTTSGSNFVVIVCVKRSEELRGAVKAVTQLGLKCTEGCVAALFRDTYQGLAEGCEAARGVEQGGGEVGILGGIRLIWGVVEDGENGCVQIGREPALLAWGGHRSSSGTVLLQLPLTLVDFGLGTLAVSTIFTTTMVATADSSWDRWSPVVRVAGSFFLPAALVRIFSGLLVRGDP
ncbi:unnamed protein product [Chondrus crispus]|uniref:Uncharacterized protein n=1 Tax=Chondrus crispus TaxID=2769 RepID=R7Q1R9_CHOCR|nr:unnamed protein product [Chondrus crispus]CDF32522.1 unnamed protein product [Chondrus crispus]|eukprot:XP_005712187.1 unnamed protein product [Chondrus crispus]